MIKRFVIWWCHRQYMKNNRKNDYETTAVFYIKGHGKYYPKYLMYTEDERVYKMFDKT